MRDGTYPSRSFATLGPLKYSRRLSYLSQKLFTTFSMFRHRADVRPYISYCNFAKSCVFSKQSLSPIICHRRQLTTLRPAFSRSYSVILPSSLDIVILHALVYTTNLPVSVFSTVNKTVISRQIITTNLFIQLKYAYK